MAEKDSRASTAGDPGGEAFHDEQLQFKKRARRRLVGAIALALLAVIVLPMVMDQEPRQPAQDIQIRIPNQDTSTVSTLARSVTGKGAPTPLPAPPKPTELSPATTPSVAATPAPTPKVDPLPAAVDKQAASKAQAAVAAPPAKPSESTAQSDSPAQPPGGEQWVVQLGAYQDPANVKALRNRIKSLGLPSFTEQVDTPQGPRTRVRSGPFASRSAAEKAQEQLKKLAIGAPAGGVVAQKQ